MSRSRRFSIALAIGISAVAIALPVASRADAPKISYDLAMPDPAAHVFDVTVHIDGLARPSSVIRMPIWIPGYYSDDQYGRNAYEFAATDAGGHALDVTRDGQSAYIVDTKGVGSLTATYKLYANRRADTGTQLAADRAVFNGAETFMYLQNEDGYPAPGAVSLTIHPPDGWRTESGLLAMQTGTNTYVAPSYDVLDDMPTIIAPHFAIADFSINAVPYHLVIDGIGDYDVNKLGAVAKQIISSEVKMMGHAGYKEYWALFLAGSGGGMEHLNSTISGMAAYGWEKPPDPDNGGFGGGPWNGFALVLAHEHFHSWNVKRIRPQILGPFRYDQENHTRRLDVAEGFTEYYTFVHGMRSGFLSPKGTWSVFADDIDNEENSPGRRIFSLGDLSWNTWWGSDDPYVPGGDYYDGAALMAMMLDFKIRHDTDDAHSIDDVMRYLFADWEAKSLNQFQSPGGTYADDAMPSIIEKATGDAEAGELFHTWWDTTTLPDWNVYLQYAGLKLVKTMPKPGAATLDADWAEIGVPMGAGFRPRASRAYGIPTINPDVVMFTRVKDGGAAETAGVEQYDVLQSFDGLAVTQTNLPSMLATHHAGDRVPVTIMRDGRVFPLTITLAQDTRPTYMIVDRDDATTAEKALLQDYEKGVPFGK
jgi:predicted metalloprotease with PDZ domain